MEALTRKGLGLVRAWRRCAPAGPALPGRYPSPCAKKTRPVDTGIGGPEFRLILAAFPGCSPRFQPARTVPFRQAVAAFADFQPSVASFVVGLGLYLSVFDTRMTPEPGSIAGLLGLAVSLTFVATCSYIFGMISTGIRELKNNLSHYVRQIEAGKRVAVTAHGRVVAELIPHRHGTGAKRYDALIAAGVIEPAVEPDLPVAAWPSIPAPSGTAARLIDEDRGE